MKTIKTMNKIAAIGLDELNREAFEIGDSIENPDGIMVRSASLHDMEFGDNLKAIVRCGAGVNNIPLDKCAEKGIIVFNTPGANANGVKELTIASLLLASRNIVGGIEWANGLTEDVAKQVEKGKSAFAGNEIAGKTLGVIGLGAIGGLVANAAKSLGMKVLGCDNFLTVEAAWHLSRSINKASSYDEIYANADYITLHIPSNEKTRGMINKESIAKMKDGVKIINLSRADLVNNADIKEAIESGKVSCYVTDFPTEETINVPGIITTPHLGASTAESEDNCAVMAAHQLDDFLQNGNITNSVNYPAISLPRSGGYRILVLHKNVPNIISQITSKISAEGINIDHMANSSKGDYACTLIETPEKADDALVENARIDLLATQTLGCDICVMHTTTTIHMGIDASPELMHKLNFDMFTRILPFAKEYGVKVATETFGDATGLNCVDFFGDIKEFLKGYNNIKNIGDNADYFGVCVDTGHSNKAMRFGNPSAADVIRMCGKDVIALHLNDNDGLTDQHKTPCTGNIDWKDVFDALDEINYNGFYNLELNLNHFGEGFEKEEAEFAIKVMHQLLSDR